MALTLYDIYEQKSDGSLNHLETVRADYSKRAVAVMIAGEKSQRDVSKAELSRKQSEVTSGDIVPGNWVVIARRNQTGLRREGE